MTRVKFVGGPLAIFLTISTLGLIACSTDSGGNGNTDGDTDGDTDGNADLVERGRYLVNDVSQCAFCHTPRLPDGSADLSNFLAGVDCFIDVDPMDDAVGCIATRNLTDHETGLANATDEEIKDAITNGIGTDGRNLLGLMPYWVFHNATDEDLDAMVAYLRTVPAVDHMTPANQPPWLEPPSTIPPIALSDIPEPDPGFAEFDSAMRGRYLSSMVSLCVDCHTPEVTPMSFDFDFDKFMAGGRPFMREELGYFSDPYPPTIYTSNLTPHATGLDGYTKADIVTIMREGVNPAGEGVCAPTHGGPSSTYAGLTDEDVEDIANYILSLPPVDNTVPNDCVAPPPN